MGYFTRDLFSAAIALFGIAVSLGMRHGFNFTDDRSNWPLLAALVLGGAPQLITVVRRLLAGRLDADILAAVSVATSLILKEYLAGTIIVLMLAGGTVLEQYATGKASSVLDALAKRIPRIAHRVKGDGTEDIQVEAVRPGDNLVVFPHEACPVDGVVIAGRGSMNEAYLTGEPYLLSKSAGSTVLSGATNGDSALTIRASRPAVDSRYAQIMRVVQETEENQPAMRRLAERLGAWYTPLALSLAVLAWIASGDSTRFLAVLVVATPCPLLIGIPVAVIGAISLAAKNGILIRKAASLETIDQCRVFVFDKTGTLTYGAPSVSDVLCGAGFTRERVLGVVASLERYSRHPLAAALVRAGEGLRPVDVSEVHELPGQGLVAVAEGLSVEVTGRKRAESMALEIPPEEAGLECVVLIDGKFAALIRFRDKPRHDAPDFVRHLGTRHGGARVVLLSGDRESEVRYLAELAGIGEVHFRQSPEEKVTFVQQIAAQTPVLFVGDGINDAPALLAATVGIALGDRGEIAVQAADAAILEPSLRRVDQLIHIGRRMRTIALQSAAGGMALSAICMALAAAGYLTPAAGALAQEAIDVAAVLNALRVGIGGPEMTDY
ncbi:MAG: cadmium-translocating P-type ATPase [Bryobacterales bacterium]|nr:cadmium-translocating P-type ATPase [Bryobacterales bacterium]